MGDDYGFKPVGAPAPEGGDNYGFKPVTKPAGQLTDVHGFVPKMRDELAPTNDAESFMGKDQLELRRVLKSEDGSTEDTSLAEDFRRAHEWLSSLPQRAGAAAFGAAESVYGLPLKKMAVDYASTGQTGLKSELEKTGVKAPEPGEVPAISARAEAPDAFSSEQTYTHPNQGTNDVSLGANLDNVTLRQGINAGVDRTIGRTERFLQRTVGRPLAQTMMWSANNATPWVNAMPMTQALQAAGILARPGPEDDYGAKQWLEILAGDNFNHPAGSPEEAQYNQRLASMYGGAAPFYKMGVSLGKQWPIFLLPGAEGKWASVNDELAMTKASELGPVALRDALPEVQAKVATGTMKQNLASGAYQSVAMAAANHEDVLQSLEEGTALSGFIGLLHVPFAERAAARSLSKGIGISTKGAPVLNDLGEGSKGALIPAKTFQQLKTELDQAIERSWPTHRVEHLHGEPEVDYDEMDTGGYKVRRMAPGGAATTAKRVALEGQMFADQLDQGQHAFDLQEGDVRHPTFSAPTVDANGQLVMRDYEITAGPGRATVGNAGPKGERAVSRPVEVSKKGQPEAWTKTVQPKATASSTNVTVRYRDTPIKDSEALTRLGMQPGRTIHANAMDDETAAIVGAIEKQQMSAEWARARKAGKFAYGTAGYMAPEEILGEYPEAVFRNAAADDLPNASLGGKKTGAERPKAIDREAPTPVARDAAMVLTVTRDGKIKMTPLRVERRAPNTRDFRPGDFVGVGHPDSGYKGTVEGVTPEGNVLIRDPAGKLAEHPKGDVYLTQGNVKQLAMTQAAAFEGKNTASPTGPNQRLEAIILANKAVTPLDVLKWDKRKPTDLAWATNILSDLEAAGKVKETAPGEWTPTKRRTPNTKEIDVRQRAEGGQLVYYDKGGPQGQWGVLRGPDTRTKGNWLIEVPDTGSGTVQHPNSLEPVYKKTSYISVPEADVRTKWPVLMADKAKVNPDIDAYGWTKPMPPSFIAQEPMAEVQKMKEAWSRVSSSTIAGAVNAKGDALWQSIVGAMHQADPGIRLSAAQKGFQARGMMRSEALAINNFLEQRLGKGTNANREMAVILEQHRARSPSGQSQGIDPVLLNNWAQKYPKEAAATLADVKAMVAQLDAQQAQLAARGVGNIADLEIKRAGDQIAEYLTTNYAAFQMPRKEWAEFARKNLTQEWANVTAYIKKMRPDLSGSGVVKELDEIMRLDNPLRGFEDRGYIKAEARAKLGAKQNVPVPIADILGQHKDASMRLAFSLAYQRQLLKSVEAFDAIGSDPALWSPGWRGDMTLKVPEDPLYGKAAGGYIADNPATRYLLEGPKAAHAESNGALRAIGWMGGKWKAGHTVYNQSSWVANVARNLKGVMLSPWDTAAYREAASMLADYGRDPTAYGPNKLLIEAMDFDAVGPGLAGNELGAEQRKFQRRIFESFQKPGSFMNTMGDIRDHALSVPETVHKGYDSIDKVAKFGSYLAFRRSFIAKGMSIDDAAALSALRVNELFPNYTSHSTPEWAGQRFGQGGLWQGLGPWATSKLQDVRVNGNIVKNLLGALMPPSMRPAYYDDQLAFRVLRLSAIVGGMATIALNTRRMNGISDAQDMLERSQIPIRSQKYSHLLIGSLDYDEHGRRTFYPMDTFEDLGMTLSGNVGDHPLARSILNNLQDVVGPDTIQGQVMSNMAASAGVITPDQQPGAPRADQTGLMSMAAKYGPGLLPQAPIKAMSAYNAMAPSGRLVNPEALTPDQATLQGLGVKQIVVGPQTHKQTLMETKSNVIHHAHDIGAAATDAALNDVSGERRKYMIQSNVRALKQSINIPRPLNPNKGPKP